MSESQHTILAAFPDRGHAEAARDALERRGFPRVHLSKAPSPYASGAEEPVVNWGLNGYNPSAKDDKWTMAAESDVAGAGDVERRTVLSVVAPQDRLTEAVRIIEASGGTV